jgi:hypothetical protein
MYAFRLSGITGLNQNGLPVGFHKRSERSSAGGNPIDIVHAAGVRFAQAIGASSSASAMRQWP